MAHGAAVRESVLMGLLQGWGAPVGVHMILGEETHAVQWEETPGGL